MPDDNRFAGLGADLDSEDADGPEASAAEVESAGRTQPSDGSVASEAGTDADSTADTVVSESTDDEEGPAFSFDETTAKSIYVREGTLAVLEDTEFEVEMRLRRDHSVRDVTGREFHDAAVHVLEDHVDEVVEAILETRDDG